MPRIAICAPACPITREDAEQVTALASAMGSLELQFHEQCFLSEGHFAGSDPARLIAFLDCANDPEVDAVWFARGGYGSNRIAAEALTYLEPAAANKIYLGYSDMGYLLAGLYRTGIGKPAHGPMPIDIRNKGETTIVRALSFLAGAQSAVEGSLDGRPAVAFNLITLAMLCGTELMPDLSGHVVMVEETNEHHYAIDRLFFHVSQHLSGVAGLRLGRMDALENDRTFGSSVDEIARFWCERSGIPFLGHADIGHDSENKIVPFGVAGRG